MAPQKPQSPRDNPPNHRPEQSTHRPPKDPKMNTPIFPTPTVVYVTDAYCGWCWGFADRLAEFEAANRHRVAFTAINGGLFIGARAGAISNYPHIPEANERISRLTGAVFGPAYEALLEKGDMVLDSLDAAAGMVALRAQAPERAIFWVHALQQAFYTHGKSLSAPETIAEIARNNGLDAQKVLQQLADGSARTLALADFAKAHHQLGVNSYPALLFVNGDQAQHLPATGTALSVLNAKLDAALAQA